MSIRGQYPTNDSFGSGSLGLKANTPQRGPDVQGGAFTVQTLKASDTPTVTICADSTTLAGRHFTGGDPPTPLLQSNLNHVWFNADADVTITYGVDQ